MTIRELRVPEFRPADAVEAAISNLLLELGHDTMTNEGLRDTPRRVAKAFREFLAGYQVDVAELLSTTFDASGYDEVVLLRQIPFYSLCEHHLLPFHGQAAVAYVPRSRVVGLSKLARLVEAHARRLQIQERMTRSIADDLVTHLEPLGVGVIVEAQHFCMCARGVAKPGAQMVTSVMTGCFRERVEARAELLGLVHAR